MHITWIHVPFLSLNYDLVLHLTKLQPQPFHNVDHVMTKVRFTRLCYPPICSVVSARGRVALNSLAFKRVFVFVPNLSNTNYNRCCISLPPLPSLPSLPSLFPRDHLILVVCSLAECPPCSTVIMWSLGQKQEAVCECVCVCICACKGTAPA